MAEQGMVWVSASLHTGRGMATWSSLAISRAAVTSVLGSTRIESLSLVAACSATQDHCENSLQSCDRS